MGQANTTALQCENSRGIEELFLEADGLVAEIKKQQQETRAQLERTIAAGKEAYGNLACLNLFYAAIKIYLQEKKNAELN